MHTKHVKSSGATCLTMRPPTTFRLLSVTLWLCALFLLSTQTLFAQTPQQTAASAQASVPAPQHPKVSLVTNYGEVVMELYPEKAPKTVDNFLNYVRAGYYNETIFHQVLSHFILQAGRYTPTFTEKTPLYPPIKNEASMSSEHTVGAVAMVRGDDPDSATSEFFINVNNNHFLNIPHGYTIFGRVIAGMDVLHMIEHLPTGSKGPYTSGVPNTAVVIHHAEIQSSTPTKNIPAKKAIEALPNATLPLSAENNSPHLIAPETQL